MTSHRLCARRSTIVGRSFAGALFATALLVSSGSSGAATPAISLDVDTRDVQHGIQHAHLTLPATPGEMRLVYPKWIQGEHGPTGPLVQVTGLEFTAGGHALAWSRDALEPFRFRVTVPDGATAIAADFDYLSPPVAGDSSSYGMTPNMTPHLAVVLFNHVLLLPEDADTRTLPVAVRVRIPAAWSYDIAVHAERPHKDLVVLPQLSAAALVDAPFYTGEFARTVELTATAPATRLSVFADAAADLAIKDDDLAYLRRVVGEAQALFGARHYTQYVWLVGLGDTLTSNGVEHHESTDIRMKESLFTKPEFMQRWASVFPHEYVHSWNGKYRRPAGLVRANFQQPLADDLLWVYEGMTRYYGDFVLRARAARDSPEFMRDYLAYVAASMERLRPGRAWRPLADTAVGVPAYTDAPGEWSPERRALDYYPEGALIWLEADTLIRMQSGGARSLDDFCRRFFGGEDGAPSVRAYTRADVVAALNAVQPFEWDAFLRARVDIVQGHAPLGGLANGGWTLVQNDTPNPYFEAIGKVAKHDDFEFSLGFTAKDDGRVDDVVHGSPAFAAGLAPAMKVIAIGGRKWNADAAKEVITAAQHSDKPIDLIVEHGDRVETLHVDWHGGLAYPHLAREAGKPDLIGRIMAASSAQR